MKLPAPPDRALESLSWFVAAEAPELDDWLLKARKDKRDAATILQRLAADSDQIETLQRILSQNRGSISARGYYGALNVSEITLLLEEMRRESLGVSEPFTSRQPEPTT